MPPKRSTPPAPSASAPSTPSKKVKQSQTSLAAFFSSPSKPRKVSQDAPPTSPTPASPSPPDDVKGEDDDALFALNLAAEEAGVSLAEMKRRLQPQKQVPTRNESAHVHPLFQKSKPRPSQGDTTQATSSLAPPSPSVPVVKPEVNAPPKASFDFEKLDSAIKAVDLTQDILQFEPRSLPTDAWPRDPDDPSKPTAPYALLSHAFITISGTRSRLIITTVLTNLMRTIKVHDPRSLMPAIYLITNHIAPNYEDVQLGIGGAIVNKAIKSVTGKSAKTLKMLWDQTGDPGDVAFEAKRDVHPLMKPNVITVQKLFAALHAIASLTHSGTGSTNAKLNHVTKLLVAARGEEVRWLVRTFHSHLRIGAVKKTLSGALARCFSLIEVGEGDTVPSDVRVGVDERQGILANPVKPKERQDPKRLLVMDKFAKAEKIVREVLARHPNFTSVLQALVRQPASEGGLPHLSRLVPLQIGVPITPMLGSITRSLHDVYTKLGVGLPSARAFVSEYKYDGQRVQIHAQRVEEAALSEDGKLSEGAKRRRKEIDERGRAKWAGLRGEYYIRLFSRHLEDMTSKYPDILDLVPLLMARTASDDCPTVEPIQSFIIDAEVVAIGGSEEELLPFQTLSNRSRKDVNISEVKVKVGVFAFDLMYLDGKSLLKASLRLRRRLLHSRFPPLAPDNPLIARFAHVKSCESNEPDEVEKFFDAARNSRCEGIMVKTLDHHWQKLPSEANAAEQAPEAGSDQGAKAEVELESLGEVVSDELSMEEDHAALEANGASESASSGSGSRKTKLEADEHADEHAEVGKGVTGRGKALLSTYEPDKRCESWLKVKRDYVDGIGDSLDLVPIGAWHGMGRKAKWWSPILLAVYDSSTGTYQAVCKCISGFTDAEYKSMKSERFPENNDDPSASCYSARRGGAGPRGGLEYDTGGYTPDVWFEPREVWEVRGADVTLSPVYPAARGLVSGERGLSLRFPRFLRRREDKAVEDASGPEVLARLYLQQNAPAPAQGATSASSSATAPEGKVKQEEAGAEGDEGEEDEDEDGADDGEQSEEDGDR